MKPAAQFSIVLVTAPNRKVARQLAASALKSRLAACANLISAVESHYWWRGKIERSAEMLLIFKTTRRRLAALEALILQEHPYDTPEFVVLTLQAGTEHYLKWIAASTEMPRSGTVGRDSVEPKLDFLGKSHGSTESRPTPVRVHRRIAST